MNEVTTKSELARLGMDALNRERVDQVHVSSVAGGVSFASALEVMEFAKLLAVSEQAVPKHLRANPGMCLAVTFQAIEWRMSPFQVANKSYVVNDRIGYESQLLHAVVEARAPLKQRLSCAYDGEGVERQCIVTGTFRDGSEREYRSPKLKDIKVKNSPLWVFDVDQQLWYFASRSWARKWCPDVLMGIYTKEELESNPEISRDEPSAPGLHEKLSHAPRPEEGFQHGNGHVERELDQVAAAGGQIIDAKAEPENANAPVKEKRKPKAKKDDKPVDAKVEPPKEITTPTTAAEYVAYAGAWIDKISTKDDADARWEGEHEIRAELSVPMADRNALYAKIEAKFA